MKIGGWRTRSVFGRYAIVSRTDMADAILKLQESERRAEQELLENREQKKNVVHNLGTIRLFRSSLPHLVR